MSQVTLRRATEDDAEWLAALYESVDFAPIDPAAAYVVIAERLGARAGAGRVVQYSDSRELGGIVVTEEHRGLGISRLLVAHLVNVHRAELLYCIPFAKLANLYASFGFTRADLAAAPASIEAKYRWCMSHYSEEVLLMRREAER